MSVSVPLPSDEGWRSRLQQKISALVARPAFWVVFVALGLTIPVVNQMRRPAPEPLPVFGTLPAFQLTDQDGRSFGSKDLQGHVWAAGFIFTRCPTICPAIMTTMGKVQKRARGIEQGFRLVSFSVDPTFDSPEKLAAYARQHRVSPRMWKLLTGPLETVRETVVGSMKIAMTDAPPETDFASVFHGTHFVLVDQQSRIRGYYRSNDEDVVDRLLHDATMLVNRGD
jgi:protein SCO1